ncbi:MAG: DNA topoisomerase I [Candidatus Micrarchaeota archaeon]
MSGIMELIVAEKPKVAQKIADAIGEKVERKSLDRISYYEATRKGKKVLIAPAVGHVYTLVQKEKSSTYPVFDIEWVPAYQASKDAAYTKPYVTLIEKLAKKSNTFVSACDYDVEGSTIAYNVFRFATKIKDGRRMKFSALTASDLLGAYENQEGFDYNNAYAGETRHILDWYYGINLSRALMSAVKRVDRYRVMSIGRVQGPSLGVLAQLEKEIRAFVPTPYWELSAMIDNVLFMHKTARFLDEKQADEAKDKTAPKGRVSKVERKEFEVKPNPNFDLTSLQVEAHRLFKFPPSRTLQIAQNLYESSLITYPRTSSQRIPPSIKLEPILKKLGSNPDYGKLVSKIQENSWTKPLQGSKDDPAHPAIHPTGQSGKMGAPESKLYDLIVRRFLASFAPSAKKQRTHVDVDAGGQIYKATGSLMTEPGWTEFYGSHYKAEDKDIPEFTEGDEHKVEKNKKTKKETKPPRRYTEASIVSELEKRHLGTKATRASIVDTLFKRDYIDGKSIEVTDFGLKVNDVLKKYAPEILDEGLTRGIEEKMDGIQNGKVDKDEVIKEGREMLTQLLDRWKKHEVQIGNEIVGALKVTQEKENMVGECDKCGKQLRIIHLPNKKQFIGCTGYPNCRNAYPLPTGAWVKVLEKPCPTCNKPMVHVKRGRMNFSMCIDPECPSKASWKKKGATDEKDK